MPFFCIILLIYVTAAQYHDAVCIRNAGMVSITSTAAVVKQRLAHVRRWSTCGCLSLG